MSYISVESSKGSFHKIQIFEFGYSALPLFYSLFRFKNNYSVEFYIRKVLRIGRDKLLYLYFSFATEIQILLFAYSAFPLFFSLFRFKNHYCAELYIRKVFHSLRRARFAKYRCYNLHIVHFLPEEVNFPRKISDHRPQTPKTQTSDLRPRNLRTLEFFLN